MRKTIRGGNHDFSTARGSLECAEVQKIVLLGFFVELALSAGLNPVPCGARRTRSGKSGMKPGERCGQCLGAAKPLRLCSL